MTPPKFSKIPLVVRYNNKLQSFCHSENKYQLVSALQQCISLAEDRFELNNSSSVYLALRPRRERVVRNTSTGSDGRNCHCAGPDSFFYFSRSQTLHVLNDSFQWTIDKTFFSTCLMRCLNPLRFGDGSTKPEASGSFLPSPDRSCRPTAHRSSLRRLEWS